MMRMVTGSGVAVVGSANLDIVMAVDHFPAPGETLLGRRLSQVAGGKGLNQAVAAARHCSTAFVGCVGDDEAGDVLRGQLEQAGVDTSQVSRVDEATGRAFIQVVPDGENTIVVMALANRRLSPDAVESALDTLKPSVVLTQLEIPLESVEAVASWATAHGARFLLNPSPMRDLPRRLLRECDPLVVNTGEARSLLGDAQPEGAPAAASVDHAANLAGRLAELVRSVAVTDGPRGVTVATARGEVVHIEGIQVSPVDTTGAGDEFAGALAAAVAMGDSLVSAAEKANQAAARIVALPRSQR
jgi:ribokinase